MGQQVPAHSLQHHVPKGLSHLTAEHFPAEGQAPTFFYPEELLDQELPGQPPSIPLREGSEEALSRGPAVENSGYRGEMDDHGRRHGVGVQRWPDGRRYAGQFYHDNFDGEATMRWPQGHVYVGQYRDNCKHGDGRFQWPDGRLYDGQWCGGVRHGYGRYIDTEGYSGEFRDGLRHGDGVLTWPDGRRYSGQFVEGAFEGYALMSWPDGREYLGQYEKNRRHGEGILSWPDGRRLEAEWSLGARQGSSNYVDETGSPHLAVWRDDVLISMDNKDPSTLTSNLQESMVPSVKKEPLPRSIEVAEAPRDAATENIRTLVPTLVESTDGAGGNRTGLQDTGGGVFPEHQNSLAMLDVAVRKHADPSGIRAWESARNRRPHLFEDEESVK